MLKVKDFKNMYPWPEIELASFKLWDYEVKLVASLEFYPEGNGGNHVARYYVLETRKDGRTEEHFHEDILAAIKDFEGLAKSEFFDSEE